MRLMIAFCVGVLLAACSANGATSSLPRASSTLAYARDRSEAAPYVYVVDSALKELIVYPHGVTDPAPMRTVQLGDAPMSVAVDQQGCAYVALPRSSAVDVYCDGGRTLAGTITQRVSYPSAIAVDARGFVYVANKGDSTPYVTVYSRGQYAPISSIATPFKGFQIMGLATDASNHLFMNIGAGVGGQIEEFVDGQWSGATVLGVSQCAGIAFDSDGRLNVATFGTLQTFAPPSWQDVRNVSYGTGYAVRFLTHGQDGGLYVPVNSSTTPFVDVFPDAAAGVPYRITRGLKVPIGASS